MLAYPRLRTRVLLRLLACCACPRASCPVPAATGFAHAATVHVFASLLRPECSSMRLLACCAPSVLLLLHPSACFAPHTCCYRRACMEEHVRGARPDACQRVEAQREYPC
jgi:hypothetical protein